MNSMATMNDSNPDRVEDEAEIQRILTHDTSAAGTTPGSPPGFSFPEDDDETEIENPRESDVLCGRGGKALRHPGNQTYRRLVNLNKGLYTTCLKSEKLKISKSIVAAVREQNGRFLEKNTRTGRWYDIGDKKAVEKTSQALREGQPKTRKKIAELGGGAAGAQALLQSQLEEERMQAEARLSATGILGSAINDDALQATATAANVDAAAAGMDFMDPRELAAAAGFGSGVDYAPQPILQTADQRLSSELPQPYRPDFNASTSSAEAMPAPPSVPMRDVSMELLKMGISSADANPAPPSVPMRDVSMELLKMSLSDTPQEQERKRLQAPQPPRDEEERAAGVPPAALKLRPSLTTRGSAAGQELGVEPPGGPTRSLSLMSEFSNFSDGQMESFVREFGDTPMSLTPLALSPATSLVIPPPPALTSTTSGSSLGRVDRRNLFARMKYNRTPSGRYLERNSNRSMGDGMPDIHLVDSNPSLFSNVSSVDADANTRMEGGKFMSGDVFCESRRSIMSGLSRISDHSEVQSIFSDLSRKIGNVSTRSIPMDEISLNMDGGDDAMDSGTGATPSTTPMRLPSLSMDFE